MTRARVPAGSRRQLGDHAVDRVAEDRPAALEAVDGADPGEEDPEEVEDLGDRGHGRARVLGRALLLDGDGRRDALDQVGVGLVHPFEELAGVGGQGLDVAALAFGVERVEGQGGLARAADPGDDDELVERDVEVDPLEVVDPDAAELYVLVHDFRESSIIEDSARAQSRRSLTSFRALY